MNPADLEQVAEARNLPPQPPPSPPLSLSSFAVGYFSSCSFVDSSGFSLRLIFSVSDESAEFHRILHLYQQEFSRGRWPSLKNSDGLSVLLNRSARLFLAFLDSRDVLCGFLVLTGAIESLCLEDLIVAEEKRGCGIGKMLVALSLQAVRAWNFAVAAASLVCREIDLYCLEDLTAFYSLFGFQLVRKGERCRMNLQVLEPLMKDLPNNKEKVKN